MKLSIAKENGNDVNPDLRLRTVAEASHCDDLRGPTAKDSEAVKAARAEFLGLAQEWLR